MNAHGVPSSSPPDQARDASAVSAFLGGEGLAHGVSPGGLSSTGGDVASGLSRASLHEFYAAAPADGACVTGALLALARMGSGTSPILWVRHEGVDRELGALYAPGMAELGVDPGRVTLVRARDAAAALQAGLEGARCAALGVAVIELWGEAKALDLTASRRLALAARSSGALVLMARIAAAPQPSAAESRWSIRAAPSRALAANAPGDPAFSFTLLRHRGGLIPGEWHLEWSRDQNRFASRIPDAPRPQSGSGFGPSLGPGPGPGLGPPLPGAVAPFPGDGPHPVEQGAPLRRTG